MPHTIPPVRNCPQSERKVQTHTGPSPAQVSCSTTCSRQKSFGRNEKSLINKFLGHTRRNNWSWGPLEMLRHFGEAPKCPREFRPRRLNPFAPGKAPLAGKQQLSWRMVASEFAGFRLFDARSPGKKKISSRSQ